MGEPERAWESGWDGHERAQRRRLAALPFMEKLAWLEESQAMVLEIARARSARGAPTIKESAVPKRSAP
jgi:hypothetical protein